VLGGDHSCAGGTWCGVARAVHGDLGLVWVDAHMDAHTPGTSHTGRLHGMPLAWLLGQDDDPLYGLSSGVLEPEHVALVGVRSFEPEEAARLARLGVRVFMMEEVRARGLDAVFAEALGIATRGTSAFGVSIDLDAVTPEEAPGVATPAAGGLGGAELTAVLAQLSGIPELAAIELVEYCPRLDPDGRSARVAVDLLAAALCGAR
jgi:arginase